MTAEHSQAWVGGIEEEEAPEHGEVSVAVGHGGEGEDWEATGVVVDEGWVPGWKLETEDSTGED